MTPCQPCRGLSRATHVLHRPGVADVEPVCSEHARNAVRELTQGEWVTVRAFRTPTPDLSRVTVWPSQLDDADTSDVPKEEQ